MRLSFLFLAPIFLLAACQSDSNQSSTSMDVNSKMIDAAKDVAAPVATKNPKELTIHGDTRIDNYYWMNDREDQNVIDFLNSENDYTKKVTAGLQDRIDGFFDEIVGRIKKDDNSVPYLDNGYYYLTKYEEKKEYPIYARKKGSLDASEEVYLDVNKLAEDYSFYNATGVRVSTDNNLLAYGEDTLSRRIYTIKFKDLNTGKMLPDELKNTTGGAVWANDNKTVFYTVKDKALRSYKIFRHVLGTDQSADKEIYHEADEEFGTFIYKTKSKKYLVIGSYQTLTQEYRILEADNPMGTFRMFEPRNKADKLEYGIDHRGDKFYVRTNWKAENFRLMTCPENATSRSNWKELIPHRKDVLLEGGDLFNDFMVLSERKEGITQIRVISESGDDHYVSFGEDAYLAYTTANREFDTDWVRIGYQSMTTPPSVFDYNMKTKELVRKKEQEILGGFDRSDYKSERIFATARDGAKVPISLVYHKKTKIDGTAPCLLYGYGSYGASMDPFFSSANLSLLNRGFVYAIAHIRGGEEMGRQWYENGKLLNKKNTFNDFIDCGEHLVENKYADPNRLAARGGSAGGLLMGAVINDRPDLFKAIVSAVPFVDVITTMLDESIPLTTGEYDEWGNPNNKEYYDYIKSYSPYDNVEAKDYPHMLVTTGLHDSQVQYWEPAKWVAKLREIKSGEQILLLKTNMEAGHGGASGRFKRFKDTALQYAFYTDLFGASKPI
ncbi:MAG: S9 family peptidase [Saprospiraceae bacterium]|nr:S9 family peptidase [Saprospiraceae bacterium]